LPRSSPRSIGRVKQIAETPRLQAQLQQATAQAGSLSTQLDTINGFLYVSADDQSLLEAGG
jgi:hypothetical protein